MGPRLVLSINKSFTTVELGENGFLVLCRFLCWSRKQSHKDSVLASCLLRLRSCAFPDPTLCLVRHHQAKNERRSTLPESAEQGRCSCDCTCEHLRNMMATGRFHGTCVLLWSTSMLGLEYVASLHHLSASTFTTVTSLHMFQKPCNQVSCVCAHHNALSMEELNHQTLPLWRHRIVASSHQLCAKLRNYLSECWEHIVASPFFTSLIGHGVFSVLRVCSIVITNWVPLSAFARGYQLD